MKRVLPNGRVEFTRSFYAVFWLCVVGTIAACIGLVAATIAKVAG